MGATNGKKSLKEWTSVESIRPPGKPCWVCGLPEREEIDAALREGGNAGSPTLIKRWLVEVRGYSREMATYNRISHHKSQGHHERQEKPS